MMPFPLDGSVYQPKREGAESKRRELKIASAETIIGFMGRLVEEKGIETLLEALPLLGDRQYRCVIVGKGPREERLRQLVALRSLENRVIFTGYVAHGEAPNWLSLFDICVLPSRTRQNWKEQFGRVILESLACGTPVIGSDSGEIPALLRNTGGEEAIFAEGNSRELAHKLEKLCDNPAERERLVAAGQQTIRKEFDQRYLAARFAATIESANRSRKA
jgi:glycosyltransferase involved in cell wall biosynthesis